jgi:hypothetical protein
MALSKRSRRHLSQSAQACGQKPLRSTKCLKLALAFLICQLAGLGELHAQRISLGVEAGVPVTESFDKGFIYRGAFDPTTTRYTVGPPIEVRLGSRFAVAFDALYQPFSFRQSNIIGTPSSWKTTGALWQFPVLLRYHILEGPIQPFIAAGPSFQVVTNITQSYMTVIDQTATISHPQPEQRAIAGFAAGGGLGFSIWRLHISPELRYTRWAAENFDFTQTNHVGTKLNQIQLLVAVMF